MASPTLHVEMNTDEPKYITKGCVLALFNSISENMVSFVYRP